MPTYSGFINGERYSFDSDTELTEDQAKDLLASQYNEYYGLRMPEPVVPPPPEDVSFLGSVGSGFQRAIGSGLKGTGELTGLEGLAAYGKELVEETEQAPRLSSEDVTGLGTGIDYVQQQSGEVLGGLAPYAAASLAGAKAGAFAGPVGSAIGAVALPALTYFFGENTLRQEQENEARIARGEAPVEYSKLETLGYSALQSGTERLGLGVIGRFIPGLNKVFGFEGAETAKETIKRIAEEGVAKSVGKGMVLSAGVEVPVELVQGVLERQAAGLDLTSDDAMREYEETIYGTIAGVAPLGGVGGGVRTVRARQQAGAEEIAQQNVAEAQRRLAQQRAAEQQAAVSAEEAKAETLAELAESRGVGFDNTGVDANTRNLGVVNSVLIANDDATTAEINQTLADTAAQVTGSRQEMDAAKTPEEASAAKDNTDFATASNLLAQAAAYRRAAELTDDTRKANGLNKAAMNLESKAETFIEQLQGAEIKQSGYDMLPAKLNSQLAGLKPSSVFGTSLDALDLDTVEGREAARKLIEAYNEEVGGDKAAALNNSTLVKTLNQQAEEDAKASAEALATADEEVDIDELPDEEGVYELPEFAPVPKTGVGRKPGAGRVSDGKPSEPRMELVGEQQPVPTGGIPTPEEGALGGVDGTARGDVGPEEFATPPLEEDMVREDLGDVEDLPELANLIGDRQGADLTPDETNTALDILANAGNPLINDIATKLKGENAPKIRVDDMSIDVDAVQAGIRDPKDAKAYYNSPSNTLVIRSEIKGDGRIIGHELVHVLTVQKLKNPKTKAEKIAVNKMRKLYKFVKTQAKKDGRDFYGLTNIYEFVSEAMTSPELQTYLANTKYENTSVLSKLAEIVAELLGVENNTALMEAITQYSALTAKPKAKPAAAVAPKNKLEGTFAEIVAQVPTASERAVKQTMNSFGLPFRKGEERAETVRRLNSARSMVKTLSKYDSMKAAEDAIERGELSKKDVYQWVKDVLPIGKSKGISEINSSLNLLGLRDWGLTNETFALRLVDELQAEPATVQEQTTAQAPEIQAEPEVVAEPEPEPEPEAVAEPEPAPAVEKTAKDVDAAVKKVGQFVAKTGRNLPGRAMPALRKQLENPEVNLNVPTSQLIDLVADKITDAPLRDELVRKVIKGVSEQIKARTGKDMGGEAVIELRESIENMSNAALMKADPEAIARTFRTLTQDRDMAGTIEQGEDLIRRRQEAERRQAAREAEQQPSPAMPRVELYPEAKTQAEKEVELVKDLLRQIQVGSADFETIKGDMNEAIQRFKDTVGTEAVEQAELDIKQLAVAREAGATPTAVDYLNLVDSMALMLDRSLKKTGAQREAEGTRTIDLDEADRQVQEAMKDENKAMRIMSDGRRALRELAAEGEDVTDLRAAINVLRTGGTEVEVIDAMGTVQEAIDYAEAIRGERDNVTDYNEETDKPLSFYIEPDAENTQTVNDLLNKHGDKKIETKDTGAVKAAVQQIGYKEVDGQMVPKTKQDYANGFTRWVDTIMTKMFSADAALNRAILRELRTLPIDEAAAIGEMLDISMSQTFHAEALSSLFMEFGNLEYDTEIHKWKAVEDANNYPALVRLIQTMAEKNGLSMQDAETIAHYHLIAKRERGLKNRQEARKRDIARMKRGTKGERQRAKKMEKLDESRFLSMTDEQIDDYADINAKFPELDQISEMWDGMRSNTLKIMVDTGIVDSDTAEVWLDNSGYVPFYREQQIEDRKGPREYLSGLVIDPKFKPVVGSQSPVNNVFDNMERMMSFMVEVSVRNKQAQSMVNTAAQLGLAEKLAPKAKGDEKTTVKVWEDGKKVAYTMADPLFIEAFKGTETAAIPMLKYFTAATNFLRKSVVLNPLFSLGQLTQDAFGAMFASGLPVRQAIKLPFEIIRQFSNTVAKTSSTHEELRRFGAVGVRDYSNAVVRDEMESYATNLKQNRQKWGAKILRKMEDFSMASDNAVRQAVYELSLQEGLSKAEAVERSFEIINFRRKGSAGSVHAAARLIPFFNAYLQAMNVQVKTLSGEGVSPRAQRSRKNLYANLGTIMTATAIYTMMQMGDDDYEELAPEMRDRMLHFGGGFGIPMRTDLFLLPKIAVENAIRLAAGSATATPEQFTESLKNGFMMGVLSPTAVPQLIKPTIEVAFNKSFFTGRDLIPAYLEGMEPYLQYNQYTSEFSKALGEATNMSPVKLDHWLRGTFGSAAAAVLWTGNRVAGVAGSRTEESIQDALSSFPGMSRFLNKEIGGAYKDIFYDYKRVSDEAYKSYLSLMANEPEKAIPYLLKDNNAAKVEYNKMFRDVAKQIAGIRKEVNRISRDSNLSSEQKRYMIKALREQEEVVLKSSNAKVIGQYF